MAFLNLTFSAIVNFVSIQTNPRCLGNLERIKRKQDRRVPKGENLVQAAPSRVLNCAWRDGDGRMKNWF